MDLHESKLSLEEVYNWGLKNKRKIRDKKKKQIIPVKVVRKQRPEY